MASSSSSNASAFRALQIELKSLQKSPVEGFTVTCDDENIFKWSVAIFGPPGTLYQVDERICWREKFTTF